MSVRSVLIFGSFITTIGAALFAWITVSQNDSLVEIHQQIESDLPSVTQVTAEALSGFDRDRFVLFDVRKSEEYAVSHIAGAIHVDPQISASEFQAQFGEKLQGRQPIFYCSVGRRSSHLVDRLINAGGSISQTQPANLVGGIFGWHNDNLPLVNSEDVQTRAIHPYNAYWGRLIEDSPRIEYQSGS